MHEATEGVGKTEGVMMTKEEALVGLWISLPGILEDEATRQVRGGVLRETDVDLRSGALDHLSVALDHLGDTLGLQDPVSDHVPRQPDVGHLPKEGNHQVVVEIVSAMKGTGHQIEAQDSSLHL